MYCSEIKNPRLCGQHNYLKPATCITRISGFIVAACDSHHACDRNKSVCEVLVGDQFNCPCPRCMK